jgi:hypothetical protein
LGKASDAMSNIKHLKRQFLGARDSSPRFLSMF